MTPRRLEARESLAWGLALCQFFLIWYLTMSTTTLSSSKLNVGQQDTPISISKTFTDVATGESFVRTFYTKPKAGMEALHNGNCWCTPQPDNFCSCTPSMAIDVILTSGDSHVWLVKRRDSGKYATLGGFMEVGETSVEAVARELFEETGLLLSKNGGAPRLFGVYDDPRRDLGRHRHSVSIVYVVDIGLDEHPQAGDDAASVVRVELDHVADLDFFIDHKTVLMDYKASLIGAPQTNYAEPFKRAVCHDGQNGYMPTE